MKETQKPITRPLAERWRDVRMRFVPVLVYAAGLGLAIYLWNTHWTPGTFLGEVQSTVSNVASPLDGVMVELTVQQFDTVVKGQVLGKVTFSPAAMSSGLAAIRTELQVMQARMVLDGQRNEQSYQQFRMDQLNQKVELGIAKAKLRFAENELARTEKLRVEKISSEFAYDFARDTRDSLLAEIKERTELIAEMDKSLTAMRTTLLSNENHLVGDSINSAITAQEEEFRQLSDAVLYAPISGVVSRIFRQQGENVASGEPLLIVSSEQAENIIGYIRQPVAFEPKAGDVVIVRSRRGNARPAGEARIVKVGPRLDLLVQMENETGFDPLRERGLPVLIDLPASLELFPGELVDLSLKN